MAALLTAAYTAYQDWVASAEKYQNQQRMVRTLECGARAPHERLTLARNEVGFFDLGKVGCADRQFFASVEELQEAREGRAGQQPWLTGPSVNPITTASAVTAFIAVNLLGLAFIGARAVFSWFPVAPLIPNLLSPNVQHCWARRSPANRVVTFMSAHYIVASRNLCALATPSRSPA